MYKLLIVDDEYLSRYALRTLIAKKFSNLEIAGEAENGRQAIEMNRALRPDIIIMDIKMPGINGIDASCEIVGEFPETNILILTAYDSFDYIKRALDIGVKGYILKPLKESEVCEKLNMVISQIRERENRHDFMETVEAKIKIIRPFMEDELISAFVTGDFNTGKVENYIRFLQEDIQAGYFLLVGTNPGYTGEINDSLRNRIVREKMTDILTKHLPLMKKCHFGKMQGNTAVVFIPVEKRLPGAEVVREAVLIGQQAKRKLKVIGDIDAAVGIGKVYSDIQDFSRSYNEAAHALRLAMAQKEILHFEALGPDLLSNKPCKYPSGLENKLIEQLKAGNIPSAQSYAAQIFEYFLENVKSRDALKEYVCEFITVLKRTIAQMGIHPGVAPNAGALLELGALSSAEEIEVWYKSNVNSLIKQAKKGDDKNTDVINRVFEYSNKNFNKNITLELAASEVGLSPQYLSKIFKEKCGINFIDYITKKRMEYARELLEGDSKNIKEVSRLAGYEDSNYFCRIFKKETGLNPKQYRTKVRIRE